MSSLSNQYTQKMVSVDRKLLIDCLEIFHFKNFIVMLLRMKESVEKE